MDAIEIVIFIYFQIAVCYLFYSIYKFNQKNEDREKENEYIILCICAILYGDKKLVKEYRNGVAIYVIADGKKEGDK